MASEFKKIFTKIEVSAFAFHIVRRTSVKAGVVARDIPIHGYYDDVVILNKGSYLRNRIQAVVVFFKRVPIAVAVKIVDNRIAL